MIFAISFVELQSEVAGQFQMLALILPDGNVARAVQQDVCRLTQPASMGQEVCEESSTCSTG